MPSWLRERAPMHAVEALEQQRLLGGLDPGARVGDDEARRAGRLVERAAATPPSNVNFSAFERRFRTIFAHMSRVDVDRLATAAGSRPSSVRPARSKAERNMLASSVV